MKSVIRRILCMLLVLCAAASLLPAAALRAEAASLTAAARAATVIWHWPVAGKGYENIDSSYGFRGSSYQREHYGMDIPADRGTEVYATRTGTVVSVHSSNSGSAGRYVIIKHGKIPVDGDEGKDFYSKYYHLQSIKVKVGDVVTEDTVIGTVGGSGDGSDSCYPNHLHFELCYGGTKSSVYSFNPCPSGYTRRGDTFKASNKGYPMEDAKDSKGKNFSTSNTRVTYDYGVERFIFLPGEGEGESLSIEITYGSKFDFSAMGENFYKAGYRISGWNAERKQYGDDVPGTYFYQNKRWLTEAKGASSGSAKVLYNTVKTIDGSWLKDTERSTSRKKYYVSTDSFVFHPVWVKDETQYIVSFDSNGGTGTAAEPVAAKKGSSVTIPGASLTKPGYAFLGWATSRDAKIAEYEIGDAYTGSGDVTLYAVWGAGDYLITYHANGQNVTDLPGTGAKNKGENYTISTLVPKRRGYTFVEWTTAAEPSGWYSLWHAEYAPGDIYKKNKNLDLYAQWKINSYTLGYHGNGGKGTMAETTCTYGQSVVLPANSFTRTGYTFVGWNTKADGSGTAYGSGETVNNLTGTANGHVTLYAQWQLNGTETSITKTYTVQYNANGGTGDMQSSTFVMNQQGTLRRNSFEKAGYKFAGWNTKADGSGTAYQDGAAVTNLTNTDKGVVTLHARWERQNYLDSCTAYSTYLTLKANSGNIKSLPCSADTLSESKTVRTLKSGETLTATAVYKNSEGNYWYRIKAASDGAEGYIFGGHAALTQIPADGVTLKISLAKTRIQEGNACRISGSVTAKNGVTLISVTGVLVDSKGNRDTEKITSGYGAVEKTALNQKLAFGKLCRGDGTLTVTANYQAYYTRDGSALNTYQASRNQQLNFSITGTYKVNYNANGGSGAPAAQTKTFGKDLTLSSAVPTRSGYDFLGWAGSKNATVPEFEAGGVLDVDVTSGNITLYAVWESTGSYTVTYDANGGTGAPAAQTKTHGTELTLSSAVPTRAGYIFLGWSENASADTGDYQAGGSYAENASVTLYAVWKAAAYTVTFDPNDGSGAVTTQAKAYGVDLTLDSTIPVREGYTFVGWAGNAGATIPDYQPGGQYTADADIILYAVWNPDRYVIRYDANGGSGAPESQIKIHGEDLILSDTIPTREGYVFIGWMNFVYPDLFCQPGDVYSIDGAVELYAMWQAETVVYSVTYDANGGSGAPERQEKISGQELLLSDAEPYLAGYTFLGWSEDSSATEAEYHPGDAYTKDDNVTLFAVWEPTPRYLYDNNAGRYYKVVEHTATEVSAFDISELCHITIELNPSDGIRSGLNSINDWSFVADGCYRLTNGAVDMELVDLKLDFYITPSELPTFVYIGDLHFYSGSFVFDRDKDIVLDIYYLWLEDNGGCFQGEDYGTDWLIYYFCANYPETAEAYITLEKEGYTFLGWSTDPDATEAEFMILNPDFPEDTTLYAIWQENSAGESDPVSAEGEEPETEPSESISENASGVSLS